VATGSAVMPEEVVNQLNGGQGDGYFESRAKEYRERYESMRTLEWQTLLQTYAGFAAIAVAFQKADERFQDAWEFRYAAMWGTLVFAAAMQYMHYRIQERLITFNEDYDYYVRQMRGQKEDQCTGTSALGHPYFWTYDTQMIVVALTTLGMLAYEAWPAISYDRVIYERTQLIAIAIALVGAILIWFAGRSRLKRLHKTLEDRTSAVDQNDRPRKHPDERHLVWYASYGSNLAYEKRFLCYIQGGTPAGSSKANSGCRDRTPPREIRPITLNFDLFFAGHFRGWGGAAAFIKPGGPASATLGRMYLITEEQFNDVVLQENSRRVDGTHLVPPLRELASQNDHRIPGVKAYGRLLVLQNEASRPVLTFTNTDEDVLPIGPPSEAYVRIIVAGLKETYPAMENGDIVEYLSRADGVKGRIGAEQLATWVAGS
jgi:hypothetical protein